MLTPSQEVLAGAILRSIVDYGVITLERDGVITSWSRGAEHIFGYSAAEVIGTNFSTLFVASDRAAGADVSEMRKVVEEGRAEDTRWHARKGGERFWANGVNVALDESRTSFLKIVRDETAARLADENRVLLLNELNHRIKNTLTMVQSIVEQTLRSGEVQAAIRKDVMERLIAMAGAHDVLVSQNWAGADLASIVNSALAAHMQAAPQHFWVEGPSVRLSPNQAVGLSLALHELATNAAKYGALTAPKGRIHISWNEAHDGNGARYMSLLWDEAGGPPVSPPARSGFGTRLLQRAFGGHGEVKLDFARTGLRCTVCLPLPAGDYLLTDPLSAGDAISAGA